MLILDWRKLSVERHCSSSSLSTFSPLGSVSKFSRTIWCISPLLESMAACTSAASSFLWCFFSVLLMTPFRLLMSKITSRRRLRFMPVAARASSSSFCSAASSASSSSSITSGHDMPSESFRRQRCLTRWYMRAVRLSLRFSSGNSSRSSSSKNMRSSVTLDTFATDADSTRLDVIDESSSTTGLALSPWLSIISRIVQYSSVISTRIERASSSEIFTSFSAVSRLCTMVLTLEECCRFRLNWSSSEIFLLKSVSVMLPDFLLPRRKSSVLVLTF
mmetsp:Transcript_28701/g.53404  ORF Transcript_28701/g.53404 Transcript_28701/m.53404 type:complete len:275 (-) Transcript_28701:196-1020(-)